MNIVNIPKKMLQGGGTQTISYATEPAFKVGDKVRVENGALVPNS